MEQAQKRGSIEPLFYIRSAQLLIEELVNPTYRSRIDTGASYLRKVLTVVGHVYLLRRLIGTDATTVHL